MTLRLFPAQYPDMGFLHFIRSNARWLSAGGVLSLSSSFGQTFFISIFAGEIMAAFDLTDGEWGGAYSLGTTASALLMMWAGTLSDRFRAKTLGTAVLVMLAAACLFMATNQVVWLLPVAVFALRFTGQGMLSHISSVAIARWFSAARGKALAISTLGFSFGEALLPLIFVGLLTFLDWRALWGIAAIASLLFIPVLRLLLTQERTPKSIADSQDSLGMNGRHWTRGEALRNWLFWAMLPSVAAPSTFSTALFFQQVHLTTSKGWDHAHFVALFPLFTAFSVLSMLISGWAIDRWGCARIMPIYQLPMAAAYFIFGLGDSLLGAAFGFALMGTMQGAAATLTVAFWSEFYGTRFLGSIKALAAAVMVLGSALGPGVTGYFIDKGILFHDQMVVFAMYILAVCSLTLFAMIKAAGSLRSEAT